MEWCDSAHGTNLSMYDKTRLVVNALSSAIQLANKVVYRMGQFMYLIMPSGWVFPLINEGEWTIPTMPEKKFWAIKVSYEFLGISTSFNVPLPKINIKSWWQSVIAPVDVYIDGSEYWPYLDEITGEVKQGISFTPVRKFGVYEHIPYVVGDILLIWFIVFALEKLGLIDLMRAFINNITVYVKNRRLMSYLDNINTTVNEDFDDLKAQVGLLEITTASGFRSINSKIGVSLRLR